MAETMHRPIDLSKAAGHIRHVRWLMRQYALDLQSAEREARRRYHRFPQELTRWSIR